MSEREARARPANSWRVANFGHRSRARTARNRGRVQLAACRLLELKDVDSTAELARWVYGWRAMHERRPIRRGALLSGWVVAVDAVAQSCGNAGRRTNSSPVGRI